MRALTFALCLSLLLPVPGWKEHPRNDYYVTWIHEKAGKEIYLSQDEFKLLCHTVHEEAGNQSLEAQRLVAVTILNRIASDAFPDDLTEVIYQDNPIQFSVITKKGFPDAYPITDLTEEACYLAIAIYPDEPMSMLFFRSKYYFSGLTAYKSDGDMYFSLKEYK